MAQRGNLKFFYWGLAVVGLTALQSFWDRRTPEETAAAVARVMRH